MNSKGQVLVVFVLILPIIILLFTYVVDLGLLELKKNSAEKEIKYIIKDSIENDTSDDVIKKLIKRNIKDSTLVNLENNSNSLEIEISIDLSGILFNNGKHINIKYIGNKETKEIEKG